MLTSRAETILKSIVRQYIVKAVPVPSQSICGYELRVSPATVRNEMVRLENDGYIIRPHPSAGSIPSDKGYRYYVESLTEGSLPQDEQRLIDHLFHQVEQEQEAWPRLTATLIARLAQNMAVVTRPKTQDCRFRHLELVTLQESLVLVILVLNGARVKQQLIVFDPPLSSSSLTSMANKLSEAYSGLTSAQILAKGKRFASVEQQLTDYLVKMMRAEEREYEEPYLEGLHFTLNQPEFATADRLLELMDLVEQRGLLRAILPEEWATGKVQVVIGKENKSDAIHNCSVVISRYGLEEEAAGIIGVIGPTRMAYERAITTINYLASVLSRLVAKLYGKKYEGVETDDSARAAGRDN